MKTKNFFNWRFAVMLITCMVFMSGMCSKKDKDSSNPNTSLVGTWKCTNNSGGGDLNYDTLILNSTKKGTWTFYYKNGSVDVIEISSWAATDSSITMEGKLKGYSDKGTITYPYSLSGKELILTMDGDNYVYFKQ